MSACVFGQNVWEWGGGSSWLSRVKPALYCHKQCNHRASSYQWSELKEHSIQDSLSFFEKMGEPSDMEYLNTPKTCRVKRSPVWAYFVENALTLKAMCKPCSKLVKQRQMMDQLNNLKGAPAKQFGDIGQHGQEGSSMHVAPEHFPELTRWEQLGNQIAWTKPSCQLNTQRTWFMVKGCMHGDVRACCHATVRDAYALHTTWCYHGKAQTHLHRYVYQVVCKLLVLNNLLPEELSNVFKISSTSWPLVSACE